MDAADDERFRREQLESLQAGTRDLPGIEVRVRDDRVWWTRRNGLLLRHGYAIPLLEQDMRGTFMTLFEQCGDASAETFSARRLGDLGTTLRRVRGWIVDWGTPDALDGTDDYPPRS